VKVIGEWEDRQRRLFHLSNGNRFPVGAYLRVRRNPPVTPHGSSRRHAAPRTGWNWMHACLNAKALLYIIFRGSGSRNFSGCCARELGCFVGSRQAAPASWPGDWFRRSGHGLDW
jgi:hypothetical protein